jgi:hypothetical protein
MKKNNLSSYFLTIAVMTFLTLFTFIVAKSYDGIMKTVNTAQKNPLGKSIDLNLNTNVIDIIESRQQFPSNTNQ